MNGTREIMQFDTDEFYINNQLLPFTLKDYIRSTENITSMKEILTYNAAVRNFFADRTLSISRENTKTLLNCINSSTNEIIDMVPLYVHNQALCSIGWENSAFDELIYEPTGRKMRESALAALEKSPICFTKAPDWLVRKFNLLQEERGIKKVNRHSCRRR